MRLMEMKLTRRRKKEYIKCQQYEMSSHTYYKTEQAEVSRQSKWSQFAPHMPAKHKTRGSNYGASPHSFYGDFWCFLSVCCPTNDRHVSWPLKHVLAMRVLLCASFFSESGLGLLFQRKQSVRELEMSTAVCLCAGSDHGLWRESWTQILLGIETVWVIVSWTPKKEHCRQSCLCVFVCVCVYAHTCIYIFKSHISIH